MKRLVSIICFFLLVFNNGKYYLNQSKGLFALSTSSVTFSPFVMGEKVSMMLNFTLKKDLGAYNWIRFKFSWDNAFPFLINNRNLKDVLFTKDAYLAFDQFHGKSQVMIQFPSLYELLISKAFILNANQTYTFTLWKEFGLMLPSEPGNYSIQMKTQAEPEWRVVANFIMTNDDKYESSQILVSYDDSNYRTLSSFSIYLPGFLIDEIKSEQYKIILSLPEDTIYYCWQIGGIQCNTEKLWMIQDEAILFDQNQVSSYVLFDKTINCIIQNDNIANDIFVLNILSTVNMINPVPGEYYIAISIDGKWYKTQLFSISNSYIPLYILKHTQDDINFLIYYHLPSWDSAIDYQTITMLLPEKWKINQNSKEKAQFDYMQYHHTEKYTRLYMVFQEKSSNKPHQIVPGDTVQLFFLGNKFIYPIQKNYSIYIVFRFNQTCPYMKTQELIVDSG